MAQGHEAVFDAGNHHMTPLQTFGGVKGCEGNGAVALVEGRADRWLSNRSAVSSRSLPDSSRTQVANPSPVGPLCLDWRPDVRDISAR